MTRRRLLVADRVRATGGPADSNAVLVEGGKVVAVGSAATLRAPGVHEQSFVGATILPGLRDAHLHPVPYAALLTGVSLKTATDLADLADRLRGAAAKRPGAIVALRMDDETLAGRRLPTRADLDDAVADRPVLVHRYCGHVAVANSAALAQAGVTSATPDPPGGVIDRDEAGEPTGVLRETAIEIVSKAMAGTAPVMQDDLLRALTALTSLGITSIGAMVRIGDGPWASLGNEAELLASVADRLPLRVHGFVIANSVGELDEGRSLLTGRSSRLRWAGLKRFADGSLGGHTAAMIDPFADAPHERGTMRLDDIDRTLAQHCFDLGGTVAIHAIGDLACRRVIDLFEDLGAAPGTARIEHASVIDPEDVRRMARLGIVGCVQPAFLGSEADWLEDRLGAERMPMAYPFASMVRDGVMLAAGSDSPVEPPDPWSGMALARDRNGIVPAEALDAEAALDLFTNGAAAALGESQPLAAGSQADLIVVDRDPITSTPDELRRTRVHHVLVGGEDIPIDPLIESWVD